MKADPTPRRIALFGNFGTGNLGNEATLQAMVLNLQRYLPNVEIDCVCPEPQRVTSDYNISGIPIRAPFPIRRSGAPRQTSKNLTGSEQSCSDRAVEPHRADKILAGLRAGIRTCVYPLLEVYRWLMGIASLKGSDLLVMTGTGMLGDFGITPVGLHYDIFRWAVIAKLCGCKLTFASVGAGPIRHPVSRYFVSMALALADYRSYRDAFSKEYLLAIGANVTDDSIYPDLAFSLPTSTACTDHYRNLEGTVIGVGVMNYYDRLGRVGKDERIYRAYLERLAGFVIRLLERGHTVRILIGDVTWDLGAREDLRKELEKYGIMYEDGKIIDQPAFSVEELIQQISSVDIVVSSRFHNLVFGLMLRRPVVAISYHEKFQPLMNAMGLGEFLQDIEHISVDDLAGKVDALLTRAPDVKLQIARETKDYRMALDEQYERILDVAVSRSRKLQTIG
jgi:polysaccharide pyruvyl transferase WcaK-like protein